MDVGKIIGKFIGNKADRDMREVTPYVEKIMQNDIAMTYSTQT